MYVLQRGGTVLFVSDSVRSLTPVSHDEDEIAKPDDRTAVQNEKERDQFELQFLCLVPELAHACICPKRPEECHEDKELFGCAPRTVFRLALVPSVGKKCDDIYHGVESRSDDDILHGGYSVVSGEGGRGSGRGTVPGSSLLEDVRRRLIYIPQKGVSQKNRGG